MLVLLKNSVLAAWTVTYIVEHRSGGASSSYISTGFFGGLAIGRVALLWINEKVGEHLIIYAYIVISHDSNRAVIDLRNIVGDVFFRVQAGDHVRLALEPMRCGLLNGIHRVPSSLFQ